ncbi:hypothetical protein JCM10914A_15400 [Paenibacillus sp. JCM 10914]|uniref:hypothetical protein n=1 Tax=Paenibacillus sp. JCM 10914 TaxID=1236974 RepID=UPI0003CC6F94|nr:hypothetical protein [Paenibacillus sp. JCM 10914]GAE09852.1 hypothetical protein JCM10914_6244 [Paenibacillus sp. JCM 10914]
MVAHLLWIVAVYGLAVALVHLLHARHRKSVGVGKVRRKHYVLVTSNHERQVEWYLRALSWYALLSGTRIRVTVLDDQSHDLTLKIVSRMTHLSGIELVYGQLRSSKQGDQQHEDLQDQEIIQIDLRNPLEAARIPYVQV